MGYNYNGRLRSAELLLKEDGRVQLIRRAETPADYFATFDCFDDLKITEQFGLIINMEIEGKHMDMQSFYFFAHLAGMLAFAVSQIP